MSEPPLQAAGKRGLPVEPFPEPAPRPTAELEPFPELPARAPPPPSRRSGPAHPVTCGHVTAVLVSPRGGSHASAHVTGRRGGMARG